ncbi:MAG: hypothetical protein ABH834_05140 [Candidatus Altiarchaeota archaeon]
MTGKKGINVSGMTICAILGIAASLAILAPILKEYVGKPGYADYQNLNQLLQENYRQGDYMLFEPNWLRGFARDLSRLQFIPDYEDNVFEKGLAERIWHVSSTDKPPKTSLTIKEESTTKIGRLRITLYEVKRENPTLYEMLGQARASLDGVEGRFDGESVVFDGLPEWTRIYRTTEYFHGDAHNAILFHPMTGNTKSLSLTDLPAGTFYLTYGLKQRFDCNPEGMVHVKVAANDDIISEDSLMIKKGGVRREKIDLTGSRNSIVIEADTLNDTCMHFYINGYHAD